jgi:hypothetical protein
MAKKRSTSLSGKTKKKVKKSQTWTVDSVFKLDPNVFYRAHGQDRVVVMNVKNAKDYFEITGMAGEVFRAIDGRRSVAKIIKKFEAKQKNSTLLKSKIQGLFRSLLKEKLILLA